MDTADFFYVLFLVFFLAIGGIVFGAWVAQARDAKARARAAAARRSAARDANARSSGPEIGVVRTDDSTSPPKPNVVTQPSNAGKQVKTATGIAARTERSKLYWDFWEQFLNRVGTEHPGWTKRKTPSRASRYNLPTGTSAVSYSTAFTQRGLSVQLYFSSPDAGINLGQFEALRAIKDEFERALGQAAEWDDKPGRKAAAICVTSQFDDVADVELWPAMLHWVLDQHVRFRQAVKAVNGVGRLKETMPQTSIPPHQSFGLEPAATSSG
jgi:Flp pilus assembly protein TadG